MRKLEGKVIFESKDACQTQSKDKIHRQIERHRTRLAIKGENFFSPVYLRLESHTGDQRNEVSRAKMIQEIRVD